MPIRRGEFILARNYCAKPARSKWFMKTCIRAVGEIRQLGNFADHATCPKRSIVSRSRGSGRRSAPHHAPAIPRRAARQASAACDSPCPVNCAPPQYRQFEFHHHVEHELFLVDRPSTPPAPSTISQSLIKLLGMLIRPRSISTPAQRAARSGETGGTNCKLHLAFRSVPIPASRMTVTRSEPSRVPV